MAQTERTDLLFGEENRIATAIESTREHLAGVAPEQLVHAEETATIDVAMLAWLQENKGQMQLDGTLTLDEALTVYAAIGELPNPDNGGWAEGTDLATKIVILHLVVLWKKGRI